MAPDMISDDDDDDDDDDDEQAVLCIAGDDPWDGCTCCFNCHVERKVVSLTRKSHINTKAVSQSKESFL